MTYNYFGQLLGVCSLDAMEENQPNISAVLGDLCLLGSAVSLLTSLYELRDSELSETL